MYNKQMVEEVSRFVEPFKVVRTDCADGAPIFTSDGPKTEINLSTAFTWMIQEAGKCSFYASDVLVDIDAIRNEVQNAGRHIWNDELYEKKIGYMAMRDMGVDSITYISNKIDPNGAWKYGMEQFKKYYTALFRVTVEVVEKYGEQRVQVTTEQFEI